MRLNAHHLRARVAALPLAALFALGACSSDKVLVADEPIEGVITVDASTQWAYVSLDNQSAVTPTPSARLSAAWDIAFNATNVTLNGGEAGPGGITAACICQNADATNDEVLAMTAESELADFESVTSVPEGLTWVSETMTPAIDGWFTGTGAAAVANSDQTYLVRLSDSLGYAKLRVQSIVSPTATSAGTVTLEYALQESAEAALGTVQTMELDVAPAGVVSVDLDGGTLTDDESAWDLRLEGFTIRVNGGVSGPGKGGAAEVATTFAETTTAVTQANAYRTDVYAGIFGTNRYYRYNILGDHRISPTFDVYLVRRGTAVFKVQILDYYSATGDSRRISFRYRQIAE